MNPKQSLELAQQVSASQLLWAFSEGAEASDRGEDPDDTDPYATDAYAYDTGADDPTGGARMDLRSIPSRTLEHLDWSGISAAVQGRCKADESARRAGRLPLLRRRDWVVRRLHEVQQLAKLLQSGDALPLGGLPDPRPGLDRAAVDATLSVDELSRVGRLAKMGDELRAFLRSRSVDAPLLWDHGMAIAPMSDINRALHGIFMATGELSDAASPELARLRQQLRRLHDQVRSEIERHVKSKEFEPHLQDDYYTLREGRYVLPVKIGSRHRIDGIVHATSASGQTVFVEPSAMMALNNEVRLAEFAVEMEIQRILQRLSALVMAHVPALRANFQRVIYLDVLQACADLSCSLMGALPILSEREVRLLAARHPLLQLRFSDSERKLIHNDVVFGQPDSTLVISGSNAGGKTVTLKTVGLCALMVRAGLLPPVEEDSQIPIFDCVYTDIGDEQSIQQDTSTFSAHVLGLKSFLTQVDGRALVLLDEPFAGTDPTHATALTIALLEFLREQGAPLSMVTTHLEKVKAFAIENPWLGSASVGFDLDNLRPTFRLHLGLPGGSCALQIAQRLALPKSLLSRAAHMLEADPHMSIENILRELEAERTRMIDKQAALDAAHADVDKLQRRLEREVERARKQQLDALDEETKTMRRDLRRARHMIAQQIKSLQEASAPIAAPDDPKSPAALDAERLRQASEALKDLDPVSGKLDDRLRDLRSPTTTRKHLAVDQVRVGDTVWSKQYQRDGQIAEIDPRKGRATLQLGRFKVTVDASDLFATQAEATADLNHTARRKQRLLAAIPDPDALPALSAGLTAPLDDTSKRPLLPQTSENTCDLRGLTVEESLDRMEMFLDWAYRRELGAVYIIHGHGTGTLKRAVRQFAPQSPYVQAQRPGERGEGGDGVTVMWLST
jgi:DNA mismatch repair protein MutS2